MEDLKDKSVWVVMITDEEGHYLGGVYGTKERAIEETKKMFDDEYYGRICKFIAECDYDTFAHYRVIITYEDEEEYADCEITFSVKEVAVE